jgi:single-strand DNA-binding protein
VLKLGVAVNGRQKDEAGNWTDKPNFFDVKVFGNQADALNNHLAKGRRVGVDGRLDWSSWEAQDGSKRSKVEIVAQSVQFLDSRGEAGGGGGGDAERQFVPAAATAGNEDFSSSASADDDIPF